MYFSTIQKVKESKKLGIYFDKKLEFEYNVENFVGKLWQILGLYRNWNSSPLAWKINFVVPVFLSVLDYKDFKYWHAAASPLRPVDLIKKHSTLRFTTGDSYNIHHCFLYGKVVWPHLSERDTHWYWYNIVRKLPSYI